MDDSADAAGAGGKVSDHVIPDLAWFVTRGVTSDTYANVEGNSHHFLRTTRATRDRVDAGQWILMYRLLGDANKMGQIYGVGRIHKVHARGEDGYAILNR